MPVTREDGTPWTRSDYEAAQRHLQNKELKPEVRAKLDKKVTDYANQKLQGADAGPVEPTGLAAYEAKFPKEPEPPADSFDPTTVPTAGAVPEKFSTKELADYDLGRWAPDNLDETLPSASRRKDLFRPPETSGKAGEIWDAIPNFIPGGRVRFYMEPSLDQFRQEMGTVLRAEGLDPDTLDEKSPDYQAYADRKWMQVYDAAQKLGEPVVRHSKMKDAGMKALAEGYMKIGAFADGFLSGLVPGGAEVVGAAAGETENMRATHDAPSGYESDFAPGNKAFHAGGYVLGAMNPVSLGYKATNYIAKWVAPAGASGLRRVVGAGLGAGTTNMAEGAIEDAAARGADALRGAETPPVDFVDEAEKAAFRGLIGTAGAVAGEGLATASRASQRSLRRGPLRDQLPAAERAGATTDTVSGVKLPDYAEKNLDESIARAGAGSSGTPTEVAVEKVRGRISREAERTDKAIRERQGAENQRYYDSKEGQERQVASELADRVADVVAGRSFANTGKPLPWRNNAEFVGKAKNLWDTEVVDIGSVPPGVKSVSLAEARKMGLEFEDFGKLSSADVVDISNTPAVLRGRGGPDARATASAGLPESSYVVLLRPKALNARELDDVVEAIDRAAKADSAKGADDPAYELLQEAARRVREKFKPNEAAPESLTAQVGNRTVKGWAARKHMQGRELTEHEQTLGHAGVSQAVDYDAMDAAGQKQLNNTLKAFKDGSSAERDAALIRLARSPKTAKLLEEVAGTRIGIQLKDELGVGKAVSGNVSSSGPTVRAGGLTGFRVRLDPAARAFGRDLSPRDAKEVPSELLRLLKRMRVLGPKTKTFRPQLRPGLGNATALGGGGLGRSIGAGERADEEPGGLTAEDYDNLRKLLQAYDASTGKEIPQEKRP